MKRKHSSISPEARVLIITVDLYVKITCVLNGVGKIPAVGFVLLRLFALSGNFLLMPDQKMLLMRFYAHGYCLPY